MAERRNSRDLPRLDQAVKCVCQVKDNFEVEMTQSIL